MAICTNDDFGALLRCYDALSNRRALTLLSGCFVLGGLALVAGEAAAHATGSTAVLAMMAAVAALVFAVGLNSAGLMLLDQADDRPVRGFGPALLGGVQAVWYAIGVGLLFGLGFALLVLLLGAVALLARIPHVGGVFAFVLGGPSAALVALAWGALLLGGPLATVAIWRGEGFLGSVGRAGAIVLRRPLAALVRFLILGLLTLPVMGLAFGTAAVAGLIVAGLYVPGGSVWAGVDTLQHIDGVAFGGVGIGAARLSIGLIWFLAWAVVALVFSYGAILIDRAVGHADGWGGDALTRRLARFRQALADSRPRPMPPADSGATATLHCPGCGAAVRPDDRFCARCGRSLI